MTSTLNEVSEVVTKRIAQLQKDIADAEALIALYREELNPLLKIAQVTSLTKAQGAASATTAPAQPVTETAPAAPQQESDWLRDAIPSRRWSQYHLAPRYRRFLDRFGTAGKVSREDIRSWYKRALNPEIQDNSLDTAVQQIIRELSNKGILKTCGDNLWSVVR